MLGINTKRYTILSILSTKPEPKEFFTPEALNTLFCIEETHLFLEVNSKGDPGKEGTETNVQTDDTDDWFGTM